MRDAEVGESLLLINHVSMEKKTPYKASHAIFVREGAEHQYESRNEIPAVMFNRILSLRAFDAKGMMVDAAVAQGEEIQNVVECFLNNDQVSYIDAHNAVRGCYSGKIERA